MKRPSPSLVARGIPACGGQVPKANLSPTTRTAIRVGDARLRELLASVVGQRHCATAGCARRAVEIGRRRVPSEGVRAQSVDRERGVNDPGVARSVRPRALLCEGRSRPAVSMSDEARCSRPSSGESTGEPASVGCSFRCRALGSRRRPSRPGACALGAAPCKVLRYAPTARCARGSRVSVSVLEGRRC
jgi:hypothetical protein